MISRSFDRFFERKFRAYQIESQAALIHPRNAPFANRIDLHLALGGSFDSSPATASPASAIAKKPWIRIADLQPALYRESFRKETGRQRILLAAHL